MKSLKATSDVLSVPTNKTDRWYAWNNMMPPGPPTFHIIGDVEVPNPGVDAYLCERVPPGFNPAIILLDLVLIQRPGLWPQMVVHRFVHFEKSGIRYDQAEVFSGGTLIAKVPVEDIS